MARKPIDKQPKGRPRPGAAKPPARRAKPKPDDDDILIEESDDEFEDEIEDEPENVRQAMQQAAASQRRENAYQAQQKSEDEERQELLNGLDDEARLQNQAAGRVIEMRKTGSRVPWHGQDGLKYNYGAEKCMTLFGSSSEVEISLEQPVAHHVGVLALHQVPNWGKLSEYISQNQWDGTPQKYKMIMYSTGRSIAAVCYLKMGDNPKRRIEWRAIEAQARGVQQPEAQKQQSQQWQQAQPQPDQEQRQSPVQQPQQSQQWQEPVPQQPQPQPQPQQQWGEPQPQRPQPPQQWLEPQQPGWAQQQMPMPPQWPGQPPQPQPTQQWPQPLPPQQGWPMPQQQGWPGQMPWGMQPPIPAPVPEPDEDEDEDEEEEEESDFESTAASLHQQPPRFSPHQPPPPPDYRVLQLEGTIKGLNRQIKKLQKRNSYDMRSANTQAAYQQQFQVWQMLSTLGSSLQGMKQQLEEAKQQQAMQPPPPPPPPNSPQPQIMSMEEIARLVDERLKATEAQQQQLQMQQQMAQWAQMGFAPGQMPGAVQAPAQPQEPKNPLVEMRKTMKEMAELKEMFEKLSPSAPQPPPPPLWMQQQSQPPQALVQSETKAEDGSPLKVFEMGPFRYVTDKDGKAVDFFTMMALNADNVKSWVEPGIKALGELRQQVKDSRRQEEMRDTIRMFEQMQQQMMENQQLQAQQIDTLSRRLAPAQSTVDALQSGNTVSVPPGIPIPQAAPPPPPPEPRPASLAAPAEPPPWVRSERNLPQQPGSGTKPVVPSGGSKSLLDGIAYAQRALAKN